MDGSNRIGVGIDLDVKASILISSMQRSSLLKWSLFSLARQTIPFAIETIVLNDGLPDETETICKEYQDRLNLTYVFTGHRNLDGQLQWRVPGFVYNIGAKMAKGEVLILSCAEMFHLNDCITRLTEPLLNNRKLIGMPEGVDDLDGSCLKYVIDMNGNVGEDRMDLYPVLNTFLPFLLSVSREEYFSIGGYDEDFTGISFDDNDLVDRLLTDGCSHYRCGAKTVHLYHQRNLFYGKNMYEAIAYNERLYLDRRRQIIRNQNREWGRL